MTEYTLPALPAPDSYDIAEKSRETMDWLRDNIKVGFTTERGPAWWADATTKDGKWEIPDGSHFPGAVPMEVVLAQLNAVDFVKGESHVVYTDADGTRQVTFNEEVTPIVNRLNGAVFSYPKAGYKIHPYVETLAGFIRQIQFDEDVAVGSVGLLRKGGQAFLQAVLPETLEVAGYGYQPYLMGYTSVDLTRATSYSTGALGAVCDNTVSSALLGALTVLKIRHTRNSGPAVQAAREKLGIQLAQAGEEIGDAIMTLANEPVSERDFALWLDEMAPEVKRNPKSRTGGRAFTNAEAKRAELTRLWTSDPKVEPWRGTAFGIVQLDNTYRTWEGKVTGEGGRIEQNYRRLVSGDTARADANAIDVLAGIRDRKTLIAV